MSTAAILVSYHTGEVLWDSLAAACAQCERVIVVDNGNPVEVRERLATDARIQLVRAPGNVGFGWGCRLGVEALPESTEHILLLNPDAVMQPGSVELLVNAMAGRPVPSIVGARLVDEAGREQRGSRRRRLTPWTLLRGINRHAEALPNTPVTVGAVSGAAMLLRRADWDALGGFDARYFLHVEDLDICRRATDAGGDVVFVPDAQVVHHTSSSDAPDWIIETHKAMGLKRYFLHYYPFIGRLLWPAMSLALRGRTRRS